MRCFSYLVLLKYLIFLLSFTSYAQLVSSETLAALSINSDNQVAERQVNCSSSDGGDIFVAVLNKKIGADPVCSPNPNGFDDVEVQRRIGVCIFQKTGVRIDDNYKSVQQKFFDCISRAQEPVAAQSCSTATTEFLKYYNEYLDKCTNAGFTSGIENCIERSKACTDCKGSTSMSSPFCRDMAQKYPDDTSISSRENRENGSGTSASDRKTRKQLKESAQMYRICPPIASKDAAAFSKKVDKAEKETERLDKKRESAQEKLDKAIAERDEKIDNLEEKISRATDNLKQRIETLEEGLIEATEQVKLQISKIQSDIERMGQDLIKLSNNMQEAGNKLFQVKSEMFARCHAESISKVTALQNERRNLAKQGKLSAGSVRSLLRSLGKSHERKMQDLVKAYNYNCTNDPTYKNAMKVAQDVHDLALKQIEQEQARIVAARAAAQVAIASLQASVPSMSQKHLQAVAKATTETYQEIENLRTQSVKLMQSSAVSLGGKQLELFNAERKLALSERKLELDLARLEIAEVYGSDGSDYKPGSLPSGDRSALEFAAAGVETHCCGENKTDPICNKIGQVNGVTASPDGASTPSGPTP